MMSFTPFATDPTAFGEVPPASFLDYSWFILLFVWFTGGAVRI